MPNVKAQLKLLYAVELIGKGTYAVYADQCRKRYPDFAAKLDEYGEHEYGHAMMAREALHTHFQTEVSREGFWIGFGKFLAYLQYFVLMGIKLWTLALIERVALGKLEKDMAAGGSNPYTEILARLPPDEEKHGQLYEDWKKRNG
jgi:hypothetical protein